MIFLYAFILLLSFYVLAKVVDDYFILSLDKLAERLKMSHDAAGATLMATGSSAPELFVAVFAVFRPGNHEAIGIGNIVGSALFNLLAIIGASAFIRKALIAKQAVLRDLFFYLVAAVLLLLTLIDGKADIFDALLMLSVYIFYVFAVVKWEKWFNYHNPDDDSIIEEKLEKQKLNFFQKIIKPVDFTINLIFKPFKHYFPVFVISIIMIAGISWVLVESAVQIARLSGISEIIISLTILAAGTSVPDLISSLIVSKQGRSGMAISNAVGSNIFDILGGRCLPFLLYALINNGSVIIHSGNIETSVYFLLLSVLLILSLFIIFRWKVGKTFGTLLISLYFAYLIWVVIDSL